MNTIDIQTLLVALHCNKIVIGGKWVKSTCPFAPWRHTGGADAHPSFGISIDPGDRSSYKCFACHEEGVVTNLLNSLSGYSQGSLSFPKELSALIDSTNKMTFKLVKQKLANATQIAWSGGPIEVAGMKMSRQLALEVQQEEPKVLAESELSSFENLSQSTLDYLKQSRHLTQKTIDTWELRWQPKAKRIAIPIRDRQGRLAGISGRSMDPLVKPKYLHTTGFRRDFYLYGEHLCVPGKPGYLVEGFFDAMFLWQCGYINAHAMMGTYLSKIQIEKIRKLFTKLVVITDGDKAGYEGAARIQEQLHRTIGVTVVRMPEGKDPDDLSASELRDFVGVPGT